MQENVMRFCSYDDAQKFNNEKIIKNLWESNTNIQNKLSF